MEISFVSFASKMRKFALFNNYCGFSLWKHFKMHEFNFLKKFQDDFEMFSNENEEIIYKLKGWDRKKDRQL